MTTAPTPELSRWRRARRAVGQQVRAAINLHRPDGSPHVLIYSTPRGGSTWLYELIGSQPGFKGINEPLNLRIPEIREALGVSDWRALYGPDARRLLEPYLVGLARGELAHMNANAWEQNWRPFTSRAVLKLLHGGEHLAGELADAIGGRVVVLLRHPIAVGLSRTELPRLDAFFQPEYLDAWLAPQDQAAARAIRARGDALELAVLHWCLETGPLLRLRRAEWVVASYEQLVVDGSPVIARVADRLALPDPARMLGLLHRASTSIRGMSTRATTDQLASRPSEERSRWLIEKWRKRIDPATEARLMDILPRLGIDAYVAGSFFPSDAYWIDPRKRD